MKLQHSLVKHQLDRIRVPTQNKEKKVAVVPLSGETAATRVMLSIIILRSTLSKPAKSPSIFPHHRNPAWKVEASQGSFQRMHGEPCFLHKQGCLFLFHSDLLHKASTLEYRRVSTGEEAAELLSTTPRCIQSVLEFCFVDTKRTDDAYERESRTHKTKR